MVDAAWLSIPDAERMLLELYDISEGKAMNLVRKALESGDVRQRPPPESERVYFTQDDGLIDFDQTPGKVESFTWPERRVHKNDLVYWAREQNLSPKQVESVGKGRRYTSDDDLVTEGAEGIKTGAWPNPHQAAQALAPRAQGTSDAAKIDRLERKIADRLNPETSRKIN